MQPLSDVAHLSSAMDQYGETIAAAIAGAPAGAERAQLQSLLDQLQQAQGPLIEQAQALQQRSDEAMRLMNDQLAGLKDQAAQAMAQREQVLAELAARKAAKKAPPPLDPELGKRLTDQLQRQFGNPVEPVRPPAPSRAGGKEVWEDWPQ